MVAVLMAAVVADFMVVGEAASIPVEEVVSVRAGEACLAADHMHRLLRGSEGRVARLRNAQEADSQRGQEIAMLPAQATISRAAISGLEIPLRRPQPQRMVNGTPSVVQRDPEDLQVDNWKTGPLEIRVVFAPLAAIDPGDRPGQSGAFRARAVKSGRTPLQREM